MEFTKNEEKKIPDGKYRIIKIGKDALFEFIRESIIANEECFFDVSDGTSIVTGFDIDWNKGEFICIARNDQGENEHLQFEIDIKELMSKLKDTTTTLYSNNRYIEFTKEDIENL